MVSDNMMLEKLRSQYFNVFDKATGDVLACGRDECKKLMQVCAEIFPGETFGDMETGRMNIPAIKDVAIKLGVI
jgi:hypothetical protein